VFLSVHMFLSRVILGVQMRKREEAADHTLAEMARKIAALDQKDRSASEKEKSLSSLTAELWAKVPPCNLCAASLSQACINLYNCIGSAAAFALVQAL